MAFTEQELCSDLLDRNLAKLDRSPNVIELFARTTLAGRLERDGSKRGMYLSVGNEAIKFNIVNAGRDGGWLQRRAPI